MSIDGLHRREQVPAPRKQQENAEQFTPYKASDIVGDKTQFLGKQVEINGWRGTLTRVDKMNGEIQMDIVLANRGTLPFSAIEENDDIYVLAN